MSLFFILHGWIPSGQTSYTSDFCPSGKKFQEGTLHISQRPYDGDLCSTALTNIFSIQLPHSTCSISLLFHFVLLRKANSCMQDFVFSYTFRETQRVTVTLTASMDYPLIPHFKQYFVLGWRSLKG